MNLLAKLRQLGTLQLALGVSVAVHALLLSVRLVNPEAFNRVFQDSPLEVVLVNAKSHERPAKAQAIAQYALAGGGDADQGRATTPLPPSAFIEMGDASETTQQKIETLQEQQMRLLTHLQRQIDALPAVDARQAHSTPEAQAQEEKRRQLMRQLAEIERRINEQNARPKKRYISPATREAVYAVYYDQLRHKIEDKGTADFPQAAGKKLYGELTMVVTINKLGKVIATQVVQGSGSLLLDRRAQAIAVAAGPFGHFSEAMRRQADEIVVVSRFKFTRDETLETKLTSH